MSIGKKFLDRVLKEAKDVDGFKDDFDITTLPATSPAVANMPLPLARQVVQLYHLLGVSAETLEMRPKTIRESAMEMADMLRTDRKLRTMAQRLFSGLAEAKGFRRAEVMEDRAEVMKNEVEIDLLGSRVMKQIEALLAAMKLPASILQRAMRRDRDSLMDTAKMLQSGALRSKFMLLGEALGVDMEAVASEIKVKEAVEGDSSEFVLCLMEGSELVGFFVAEDDVVSEKISKARVYSSADEAKKDAQLCSEQWPLKDNERLVVRPRANPAIEESIDPAGADMYADAVMDFVAAMGVPDTAFARNARMMLAKEFRDMREEVNVSALTAVVKRLHVQFEAARLRATKK